MNKGELLEAISNKASVNKATTAAVFNTLVEVVTEQLKAGDKITVAGFGTFESKHKEARKARNLHTGEEITVPARNVPKFTFGKNIKEALK